MSILRTITIFTFYWYFKLQQLAIIQYIRAKDAKVTIDRQERGKLQLTHNPMLSNRPATSLLQTQAHIFILFCAIKSPGLAL